MAEGSIEGGAGLRDLSGGTGKFSPGATHTPSDLNSPTRASQTVTRARFNAVVGLWLPDDVADAIEEALFEEGVSAPIQLPHDSGAK